MYRASKSEGIYFQWCLLHIELIQYAQKATSESFLFILKKFLSVWRFETQGWSLVPRRRNCLDSQTRKLANWQTGSGKTGRQAGRRLGKGKSGQEGNWPEYLRGETMHHTTKSENCASTATRRGNNAAWNAVSLGTRRDQVELVLVASRKEGRCSPILSLILLHLLLHLPSSVFPSPLTTLLPQSSPHSSPFSPPTSYFQESRSEHWFFVLPHQNPRIVPPLRGYRIFIRNFLERLSTTLFNRF